MKIQFSAEKNVADILMIIDFVTFSIWRKCINTFTASVDLSRSNFSNALFQLRQETCTAASLHLADVIIIPYIVYYAYVAILLTHINPGYLNSWQQMCSHFRTELGTSTKQPLAPAVLAEY
jgi:hypothetical protein